MQVVDKARKQSRFVQCVADVFIRGFINPIHNTFQVALNDVERCAQFMGDVGSEIAALLFGAFQFHDHFIEALEQFAKHVGIVFGHARG